MITTDITDLPDSTYTPEDLGVVSTTPPEHDEDAVSFAAGPAEDPNEYGDPQRHADEPWDEFDPEAVLPTDEEGVSFGNLVLEDSSTFERWLQSALKAVGADPELVVDGRLGRRTRLALKNYQHRLGLTPDGIAGPKTLAALARDVGVAPPGNKEAGPPARPPVAREPFAVTTREVGGNTEYEIRGHGDAVRFSYMPPPPPPNKWRVDDYCVSSYSGGKGGRDGFPVALAREAGFSQSEARIAAANALKESAGKFGAINTYDRQLVSWGMAQFAGRAGTLAAMLLHLKADPRGAAAFDRWFASQGIDVVDGAYPWGGTTKHGAHVVVDGVHVADDGWRRIREQPRLLGAFMLAGNDVDVQRGQMSFWRDAFFRKAINKVIGKAGGAGARVASFLTAERSIAVIVRLYNWMPAYVVPWCDDFLAVLAKERPELDVYDPRAWDQGLENRMIELISERRIQRKGRPGYSNYAVNLSSERGTFRPG